MKQPKVVKIQNKLIYLFPLYIVGARIEILSAKCVANKFSILRFKH